MTSRDSRLFMQRFFQSRQVLIASDDAGLRVFV